MLQILNTRLLLRALTAATITIPGTWWLSQPSADAHHGDHGGEHHDEKHQDEGEEASKDEGEDEAQKADEQAEGSEGQGENVIARTPTWIQMLMVIIQQTRVRQRRTATRETGRKLWNKIQKATPKESDSSEAQTRVMRIIPCQTLESAFPIPREEPRSALIVATVFPKACVTQKAARRREPQEKL
jgi:hypothetical protein